MRVYYNRSIHIKLIRCMQAVWILFSRTFRLILSCWRDSIVPFSHRMISMQYSNSPAAKKRDRLPRWIFATIVTGAVIFLGFQTYVYAEKILQTKDTWGVKERKIVTTNLKFTMTLYKEVCSSNDDSNIFLSPFSITSALGLVLLGSHGNTSEQIINTLSLDDGTSRDDFHTTLKYLLRHFGTEENRNCQIHLSNAIFLHKDYNLLEKYENECSYYYNAKSTRLDFLGETEPSRLFINEWVQDATKYKIKELLGHGSLDGNTKLILANTIYFLGNWTSRFPRHLTAPSRKFFVSETERVEVAMMHQKGRFQMTFVDELDAQVLKLPYEGGLQNMVIILPRSIMGIYKVDQNINAKLVQRINTNLRTSPVDIEIYLPKFTLTQDYSLKDTLYKLGIRHLFDEGISDLSGINKRKDLFVNDVIHKAFINVDETGSEAAAATGITVELTSASLNTYKHVFKADHPFMFYIQDSKTGVVLFQGRVMKPNSADIEPHV